MTTKESILEELQKSMLPDGTAQFTFSHDMSTKQSEQEILKELEIEGHVCQLTAALGYALYRVL